MFVEFTPINVYEKIIEQEIFENVFLSFVVTEDGKMIQKITEGKYYTN